MILKKPAFNFKYKAVGFFTVFLNQDQPWKTPTLQTQLEARNTKSRVGFGLLLTLSYL